MEPSALAAIAVSAAVGVCLGRVLARRQGEAWTAGVKQLVDAIGAAGTAERDETLRAAEVGAREEALAVGAAFEASCRAREADLDAAHERLARREEDLRAREARFDVARD